MSFDAKVFRVMIASPGDVQAERTIATDEVNDWNALNSKARGIVLLPVKWETHTTPQMGEHPQAVISRQILADADILIAIFGLKLGTPTPSHESGTVEEIAVHSDAGRTVKLYFSRMPLPRDYDRPQFEALQQYAKQCQSKGLYSAFDSLEDFRSLIRRHLALELQEAKYTSQLLSSNTAATAQPEPVALRPEAYKILKGAALSDGQIQVMRMDQGTLIFAGGEQLNGTGNARESALWDRAISEMLDLRFIEQRSKALFVVTDRGYRFIEGQTGTAYNVPLLEVALTFAGPPNSQALNVKSTRPIEAKQLDFLTSNDAVVTGFALDSVGLEFSVKIPHTQAVALFNSPRPDKAHFDHSGPAKLRLRFVENGRSHQVVLPVLMSPTIVNATQYISFSGADAYQIR